MRAREPDRVGYVERDGVRVGYEVFGAAGPAIIFLPSWQILHSRQWKLQAPYLARYMRVITYDARGNGRSDRPAQAERYAHREIVADAVAVLDAVGVDEAVFAGTSMGALYGLQAAAWYPERVRAVVAIGSVAPYVAPVEPGASPFYDVGAAGSVAAFCAQRGLPDYRAFVEYFMGEAITEPHRTKPVEDAVGWGLETTPEVLALTVAAREGVTKEAFEDVCRAVRCPVLVVHGDEDGIIPYEHGVALAELLGVGLVTLEGGGHLPSLGDPVRCNLLIREFVEGLAPTPEPPRRWSRALRRRRRALVVSSPIGLGHARRDVAIVHELRALHPDLDVQWLAQHPVTAVLAEHGESVHPASDLLAGESAHVGIGGGRARPARLPGLPAHGRDPGRQLHGLPRPRDGGALRPRGRRRGLGHRLLPAREPGAQAQPVRLAHRLRRLAADARRRRGRGRAHRRLQRRDDRADRPLPADARPVDLRRQPRRPRRRTRSGPACPACGTGRPRTSRSRVTSPVRRRWPTGRPCASGWATGPTSACAWWPWAGRGSAGRCCAASPTRSRTPRRRSPSCGWWWCAGRGSTRPRCPCRRAWRSAATCRSCTASWRRATSPWCRAG